MSEPRLEELRNGSRVKLEHVPAGAWERARLGGAVEQLDLAAWIDAQPMEPE